MTKVEKREEIEAIMREIFEVCKREPEHYPEGLGKYEIKAILMEGDEDLRISINTVKRIVDDFLKRRIIECINPEARTDLRFKMREV